MLLNTDRFERLECVIENGKRGRIASLDPADSVFHTDGAGWALGDHMDGFWQRDTDVEDRIVHCFAQ